MDGTRSVRLYSRKKSDACSVLPGSHPILDGKQSEMLAKLALEILGNPLAISPGFAATTFYSNGSPFSSAGSQKRRLANISVSVKPELLDPAIKDRNSASSISTIARILPSEMVKGAVQFPCHVAQRRAHDQILPLSPTTAVLLKFLL